MRKPEYKTLTMDQLKLELIKVPAVSDYLCEHGANDEKINEAIRLLNQLINLKRFE